MSRTIKALVPGLLILAVAVPSYGVPKPSDIPPLIKQLDSKDAKARADAAREIGRIGLIKLSYVRSAIPALLDAAKDDNNDVRMAALAAIGITRPEPDQAVPVFTDALKSDNDQLKMAAMEGLRYYGENAKAALPELNKMNEELNKLDKDEQKKKRNLMRAVRDTLRAINGR
ncbi:MAG: HEAT repeat domain-containing protein [Gemmataceae bacterium]